MNRIYLAVPFAEKDEAKLLGAKWDGECKKWYCEKNNKNYKVLLEKWEINDTPIELIGEDREFGGNTLFIDLVPSTCWFSNVRSCIHPKDWDRVRNHIYERTHYTCECCGINTKEDTINGQLEAHERWNYDEENKIQKLMRIVSLCHQCHQSTHMGLAGVLGKRNEAETHLKKVCIFTDEQVKLHRDEAFALWRKRNESEWKLDISLITNNDIETITPDVVNNRVNLLTNNDTVHCGNCTCYLPKTAFHNSTLKSSKIKICNKCRKSINEIVRISNEAKTTELQYTCKSCKRYFENGVGLLRFRFSHYVGCKKYKLEQSRCDKCYRNGNYEDSQIILTGGKIGNTPDQQLYL